MPLFNPIVTTVTTAGTRVQVTSSSILVRQATFRPLVTNSGEVYIGDDGVSSSDGFPISPGDSYTLRPHNGVLDLAQIYVDADTSGDKVAISVIEDELG